ncbi:hypothetical protein CANINC_004341 [Pichia inconspicua]|uniref:RAVE complex protein Rav1 C-terminal domain-containing protein n=1 Tax=Pichia inconspicua TaxID=52247 RepID=A0A4T0WXZ0_9ASCO|nr:hypothetical protein CANINC_004341 [[Candida] inconspicua]
MTVNFLPGQPNCHPSSCSYTNWNTIQILTYTSGNNLVILTKNSTHLQTIYLPSDSFVVDVNRVNGKIAICVDTEIYIYTPEVTNYFNFNFHGRKNLDELKIEWKLEHKIANSNDKSTINCISWSDYTVSTNSDSNEQFLDLPQEFNSRTACELIVGSEKSLTLHKIFYDNDLNNEQVAKCSTVWHKPQPNPVYKVSFSPNASCIASIGFYDKNVKLWHRTGFTTEYCDFELHYLLHDTFVTDIIWKTHLTINDPNNTNTTSSSPTSSFVLKPFNSIIKNDSALSSRSSSIGAHSRKNQHNVLYTFTEDSTLQVYSTFRSEKGFTIFDSGKLDLFEDDPLKREQGVIKSAVFIDNEIFELGMRKVLRSIEHDKGQTRRYNKINELMNAKSELCMVIGNDGIINLYALTNLTNPLPTTMVVKKLDKLYTDKKYYNTLIRFRKYCLPTNNTSFLLKGIQYDYYSDYALTLVIHDLYKNTIREVEFKFETLLQFECTNSRNVDYAMKPKEVEVGFLKEKFTGHNKSVKKLVRSNDGSTILSLSRFNENYLWRPIQLNSDRTTISKSLLLTESPVIDAVIWNDGKFVFTMLEKKLVAYKIYEETNTPNVGHNVGSIDADVESNDLACMFILPEATLESCHIVVILKDGISKTFEFEILNGGKYTLEECTANPLPIADKDELHLVSVINPVGWETSIEMIGRDVLATVSKSGMVKIYYASFVDHKIDWHLKDYFRTGIKNCSFISGSSINQMAIMDETRTKLSIWDMKIGVLDYFEEFEGETIKDLDWTSTMYKQGILAVGFKSHALLFTQLRYDYTNRTESFAKIKQVDISGETTHEIGDSIWMKDGLLVTGAGNQLYLSDKKLDLVNDVITKRAIGTLEISSNDIFHLCAALNGPLPLYHPQFIIQSLFRGKNIMIREILLNLSKIVREIDLGLRRDDDFNMDVDIESILESSGKSNERKKYLLGSAVDSKGEVFFDKQASEILCEKLKKIKLPLLTGHQQITLTHTVSIMKSILLQYVKVLDENALRFYMVIKLFTVNMTKGGSDTATIRNRDMTFALHSDNKDLLYDIVLQEANSPINWAIAKRYLLPYWLDRLALREVLEKIAVNEFSKYQRENNGSKDPTTCSIFYLTLKKKNVLLGLWKNSFGHPERDKMVKFLSNDFTEKRWKMAAMKNAYVLLGKHRYVDAVSFFLLAGSPKDAVNVITKNLKDIPLAVAVSRCYEDQDNNESMRTLIERSTLMDAILGNDRWMLSWIFWILGDKAASGQALIKPLHLLEGDIARVLPNFKWPSIEMVIRTSNTEDPVLLIMYESLRKRKIEYYEGITGMDPRYESLFVMKVVAMYTKMGCDWLALDLVRNWEFVPVVGNRVVPETRKKPGDILSKFGSNIDTYKQNSVLGYRRRSVLDDFDDSGNKSMLDGYAGEPKSMLDGYVEPVPKPRSVLDNYVEPVGGPKSMLDEFKPECELTKSTNSKPAPAANLLDQWM